MTLENFRIIYLFVIPIQLFFLYNSDDTGQLQSIKLFGNVGFLLNLHED